MSMLDTDHLITNAAGMSIGDIFAKHGEVRFRDLETHALRQVLERKDAPGHVVATGGGVIMRQENRELLRQSGWPVIYLACSPEALLQRIRSDTHSASNRPNLTALGGGLDEIRAMMALREPLYREVATSILEVTELSAHEVADAILKGLSKS